MQLKQEKAHYTYVQPDVLVVCDRNKLDGKGCNGAPDLVIEILSPSTMRHDMMKKFAKYTDSGVREIWFADYDEQTILAYKKNDKGYAFDIYRHIDKITVGILPELTINMKEIFGIEDKEVNQ